MTLRSSGSSCRPLRSALRRPRRRAHFAMPKASKRARGDDDEDGGGPATRTRRQRDITEHSEKPESEKQPEEKRCPICLEDWFNCDRGGPKIFQTCCGGRICGTCDEHIAEEH